MALQERLDFSFYWQNAKFSDFDLILRPLHRAPLQTSHTNDNSSDAGPSTSASPTRRTTRSMARILQCTTQQGSQAGALEQQLLPQPQHGAAAGVGVRGLRRARSPEAAPARPSPPPGPACGSAPRGRATAAARDGAARLPALASSARVVGSPAAASGQLERRRAPEPALTDNSRGCSAGSRKADEHASPPPCSSRAAGRSAATHVNEIRMPVHATVLTATSEYFKTLIEGWSSHKKDKVITLEVDAEDMKAAQLMLEYMYTGVLPVDSDPSELLRMIKLADQFRVTRFLSACNSALDQVDTAKLTLDNVISILTMPSFLLESASTATARRRAEEKLAELFGDLEAAWFDSALRKDFLRLPYAAVHFLLSRTETAVYSENTVLVAVSEWLATQQLQQQQQAPGDDSSDTSLWAAELFGLVRLPFLSSAFLAILPKIEWVRERLTMEGILHVLRLARSEGRVNEVLVQQHGVTAVQRLLPERTALEMEWTIRRADIMDLVNECRMEAAASVESTRLFSEPGYYHGGFFWRMVFFVQKKSVPKKRRYGDVQDQAPQEEETVYHDFLGITCKAHLGSESHAPLVGMTVELTAGRFNALGEAVPPQRAEVTGYVEDEIPYGVYDFFRVENLADAQSINPYTCTRGHVHLACKITRCH